MRDSQGSNLGSGPNSGLIVCRQKARSTGSPGAAPAVADLQPLVTYCAFVTEVTVFLPGYTLARTTDLISVFI
jgi:hypothetical protein